jgi:endonuclease VIII
MLEGQEVKVAAGRISSLVKGKEIVNILFKNMDISMKNRIMDSRLEKIKTFGRNLIFRFSSGFYLQNHMMLWVIENL